MSDWSDDYETCRYCGAQGERGSGAVCHSPWRAERCQQPPRDDLRHRVTVDGPEAPDARQVADRLQTEGRA